MKHTVLIFLFFLKFTLNAQPGYDVEQYTKVRFAELTEKLNTEPNNYELIWERITLTSFNDTYFDMYKTSGGKEDDIRFFTYTELLNDLNTLISKNVIIGNHNIAEFKLLRGRLFYFNGEIQKARNDFFSALEYPDAYYSENLKDKIYISIAAYFYNLEKPLTEENAKQALKYINLVNPNSCSNQQADCSENEKKELLTFLKEEEKLIDYHKKLIYGTYDLYTKFQDSNSETTNNIYFKNQYYFSTLNRIYDLVAFYWEKTYYQDSKILEKMLIQYLPPDKNGKTYQTFPKESIYAISGEQYNIRFTNLNYKQYYRELTWDYQDLTPLIESIKKSNINLKDDRYRELIDLKVLNSDRKPIVGAQVFAGEVLIPYDSIHQSYFLIGHFKPFFDLKISHEEYDSLVYTNFNLSENGRNHVWLKRPSEKYIYPDVNWFKMPYQPHPNKLLVILDSRKIPKDDSLWIRFENEINQNGLKINRSFMEPPTDPVERWKYDSYHELNYRLIIQKEDESDFDSVYCKELGYLRGLEMVRFAGTLICYVDKYNIITYDNTIQLYNPSNTYKSEEINEIVKQIDKRFYYDESTGRITLPIETNEIVPQIMEELKKIGFKCKMSMNVYYNTILN